jgi:hypothetical protein
MKSGPARPRGKVERAMLAHGMNAMVRAWVTRDGMEHFDSAFFGGVTVADALDHYSKTMGAAQRNNPSIGVGRADVIDLISGETNRIDEGGDPR